MLIVFTLTLVKMQKVNFVKNHVVNLKKKHLMFAMDVLKNHIVDFLNSIIVLKMPIKNIMNLNLMLELEEDYLKKKNIKSTI